jgi:hypothetical protein
MPIGAVRYRKEPLCQLPKTRFEAKVLFGDILSLLVCRQNVAKNGRHYATQFGVFLTCPQ